MKAFCPFLKEDCRRNECVIFRNEECLVVSFLQGVSAEETEEEIIVPKWILKKTPEELSEEILEFRQKELPEERSFYTVSESFWESKGVERSSMPLEVRMKIDRVDSIAEERINEEKEAKIKQQWEKEKEELPSLVNKCVDWARSSDVNRLTLADVDTYIIINALDVLDVTRRALYAMVNVKLRSKKRNPVKGR